MPTQPIPRFLQGQLGSKWYQWPNEFIPKQSQQDMLRNNRSLNTNPFCIIYVANFCQETAKKTQIISTISSRMPLAGGTRSNSDLQNILPLANYTEQFLWQMPNPHVQVKIKDSKCKLCTQKEKKLRTPFCASTSSILHLLQLNLLKSVRPKSRGHQFVHSASH